jgi:hypothetical protein
MKKNIYQVWSLADTAHIGQEKKKLSIFAAFNPHSRQNGLHCDERQSCFLESKVFQYSTSTYITTVLYAFQSHHKRFPHPNNHSDLVDVQKIVQERLHEFNLPADFIEIPFLE